MSTANVALREATDEEATELRPGSPPAGSEKNGAPASKCDTRGHTARSHPLVQRVAP